MTDRAKELSKAGVTVLGLAFIAFGGWGVAHEQSTKLTDVHAIAIGVGLLLVVPGQLASGIITVGSAIKPYLPWGQAKP